MQQLVEGYLFRKIGAIALICDESGDVVEEMPQCKYKNANKLPLNNYGHGPFCRFRLAYGHRDSGVYMIVLNDTVTIYVGECQNVNNRFSSNGYGGISPRNCFKGGQETNCRINALILRAIKDGAEISVWLHEVDAVRAERLKIETLLKNALKPAWNR